MDRVELGWWVDVRISEGGESFVGPLIIRRVAPGEFVIWFKGLGIRERWARFAEGRDWSAKFADEAGDSPFLR